MRYIISSTLASLLLCAPLAAPARADVPQVVTDIPPVQSLVAQVMGDLGTPTLLLAKGASEHDFQLRPSQARALADAGLVVWVGPDLTPGLSRALTDLSEAQVLALLAAPETFRRPYSDDGAHLHDPSQGSHDHGNTDPHAWLDPDNAKAWLGLIAARLAELDPDNAATYAANAESARQAIDALDRQVRSRLDAYRDRPFIVFHDAYGYFARHYGLSILGSVALGDATTPGAAKLAALHQAVGSGPATCIFPEAQHDPALVAQLAQGTSLRIGAPLDPVGSTGDFGPDAYGTLIGTLADSIATCLSTAANTP